MQRTGDNGMGDAKVEIAVAGYSEMLKCWLAEGPKEEPFHGINLEGKPPAARRRNSRRFECIDTSS